MRAFPTDRLNFLETVQVYFLEVTGKGVVLGSRDAELLQAWRAEGATAASICQGIDDAVRAREELPRSIAGCRKWIEPRVEAARALYTGRNTVESAESNGTQRPDDRWAEDVLRRVEAAGRSVEREQLREAYRAAYRRLKTGISAGEEFTTLVLETDAKLADAFWDGLTDDERQSIDDEIETSPQLATMGEQARGSFVEARRRRLMAERHDLIELFS